MTQLFRYILLSLLFLTACTDSPQQADPNFTPQFRIQTYQPTNSPVVLVDEAHHNFLTINGRFAPFKQVLLSDGFTVKANTTPFTGTQLAKADILVIANALDRGRADWQPPYELALTQQEVEQVVLWVKNGGALLLIADHAPFPAVIDNLAKAFGVIFTNGHVSTYTFKRSTHSLAVHAITSGRSDEDKTTETPIFMQPVPDASITQVKTFGGSAFQPPEQATSLLTLGTGTVSHEPAIPFQISADSRTISTSGWSQGAVLEYGKGRVSVFAEGMMFSSQLDTKTGQTYGLRSPGAEQNEQFLLNVMHWLAGGVTPFSV